MSRNDIGVIGEGSYLLKLASLAVILFSSLIVSCGLDNSIFYSPPSFTVSGNTGPIILQHNTMNIDGTFLGYEVYYRVYADLSSATLDLNYIVTLNDTTNYTPLSAFNLLLSRKFVRLQSRFLSTGLVDTSPPLFHPSNYLFASQFTIQAFNTLPTFYFTIDSAVNAQTQLVRNTNSGTLLVSFNSLYNVGDPDYAGTIPPSANGSTPIYIVMFAVAYGFDFSSSGSTIYSFPVGGILWYYLPSNYPITYP